MRGLFIYTQKKLDFELTPSVKLNFKEVKMTIAEVHKIKAISYNKNNTKRGDSE